MSLIGHEKNILEEYISQSEAKGYITSRKYYDALIENEKDTIEQLKEERDKLLSSLETAMASGAIEKNSEAWTEMCSEIDDVTLSIEEANTAILEYGNSIRDIEWEVFDLIQDKISQIIDESNFLIDLMSNDKLYDDIGQLTNEGMATMGLHGQNYNVYMEQADKYAQEILNIDKQLAEDPYNQDLVKRRQELLGLQRDSIIAAENEKQAIKDMVEEGINLELSSLNDLIDKYKEALDSQQDLYNYQKKVSEQSKNIASLQKQLSAYANDTSEEAKAKIQQIKVSLEDAKSDLKDTEYERYISEQKKLLDNLYTEYEEILNARLDNIDTLISDMIDQINVNASIISDTLSEKAESVGYTLSDSMSEIWRMNTESITSVLTTYGDKIYTTLSGVLSSINDNIQNMMSSINSSANTNVQSASNSSAANSSQANTSPTPPPPSSNSSSSSSSGSNSSSGTWTGLVDDSPSNTNIFYDKRDSYPKSKLDTEESIVDRLKYGDYDSSFSARSDYYASMGFSGKYTGSAKQNKQMIEWMSKNGYSSGRHRLPNDEIAWTQENGAEMIVRPSDGAILTPLAKNDSILNANASSNIWDMANNPADFIRDNLRFDGMDVPNALNTQNNFTQTFDKVVFNLPNVKNYSELLSEMQKDKNFEKLILSMTIDRVAGKSSLAKGKSIR